MNAPPALVAAHQGHAEYPVLVDLGHGGLNGVDQLHEGVVHEIGVEDVRHSVGEGLRGSALGNATQVAAAGAGSLHGDVEPAGDTTLRRLSEDVGRRPHRRRGCERGRGRRGRGVQRGTGRVLPRGVEDGGAGGGARGDLRREETTRVIERGVKRRGHLWVLNLPLAQVLGRLSLRSMGHPHGSPSAAAPRLVLRHGVVGGPPLLPRLGEAVIQVAALD